LQDDDVNNKPREEEDLADEKMYLKSTDKNKARKRLEDKVFCLCKK
jgi:hypothetical protein